MINQRNGDLTDAVAIYYNIAALLKKGAKENDITRYDIQIENLLKLFFARELNGQSSADYDANTIESSEYKKIQTYLCEIDQHFDGIYNDNEEYC